MADTMKEVVEEYLEEKVEEYHQARLFAWKAPRDHAGHHFARLAEREFRRVLNLVRLIPDTGEPVDREGVEL